MFTFNKLLSVWWSWFWRATVVGFLAGMVFGFLGGVIASAGGIPQHASTAGGVMGWLASIPVGIWALWAALKKHRASFGSGIAETFG